MRRLTLDGSSLTVQEVCFFVNDESASVDIAESTLGNVEKAREFLMEKLQKSVIYGFSTGFGPMASHIINHGQLVSLQKKSHTKPCGGNRKA